MAEAPLELRALETPCSFGLLLSSSPAGPQGPGGLLQCPPRSALGLKRSPGSALLGSPRRASPRVREPPPPLRRLANNQAPSVSRQRNLRNASARSLTLTRAHTGTRGGRAGAWQTVLLPFLPKEAAHVNSGKLLFLGIGQLTQAPPTLTTSSPAPTPLGHSHTCVRAGAAEMGGGSGGLA